VNENIQELLWLGATGWNAYRVQHPEFGADDGSYAKEPYEDWIERTKDLVAIDFVDVDMRGRDLSGYDLRRATFFNSDCRGARFENSNLSGSHFEGTLLQGSRFVRADFRTISFFKCDLDAVQIVGCSGVVIVDKTQSLKTVVVLGSTLEFIRIEAVPVSSAGSTLVMTPISLLDGTFVEDKSGWVVGSCEEILNA
jgi:uncharacterized protein YjbI with pentapeptide repeats